MQKPRENLGLTLFKCCRSWQCKRYLAKNNGLKSHFGWNPGSSECFDPRLLCWSAETKMETLAYWNYISPFFLYRRRISSADWFSYLSLSMPFLYDWRDISSCKHNWTLEAPGKVASDDKPELHLRQVYGFYCWFLGRSLKNSLTRYWSN